MVICHSYQWWFQKIPLHIRKNFLCNTFKKKSVGKVFERCFGDFAQWGDESSCHGLWFLELVFQNFDISLYSVFYLVIHDMRSKESYTNKFSVIIIIFNFMVHDRYCEANQVSAKMRFCSFTNNSSYLVFRKCWVILKRLLLASVKKFKDSMTKMFNCNMFSKGTNFHCNN